MNRILLAFSVAVALLSAGCPSPQPGACKSSADCTMGQSCISQRCVGGAAGGAGGGSGGSSSTGGGGTSGTGGGVSAGGSAGGGSAGGMSMSGGESCELAAVIAGTTNVSGTTVGAANDVNLTCTGARNQGPDRVYKVTVPPMERLTVTLTPEETDTSDGGLQFDPSLYLVAGPAASCLPADAGDRTNCLDGSDIDAPPGSPERVTFLNSSSAPREVFVVVDSFFTAPDDMNGTTHEGRYDLAFTLAAPPMGDRCDTATTVMAGTLSGQSLTNFSGDYGFGTNCRRSDGPDRAYKISVPAGQRLTAVAAPASDGGFDTTLNLIAGPATACEANPLVCLIGADSTFTGQPERVDYLNRGAAAQDVFVVVGSYDPTDTDTAFSLTTSVAAPPAGDECATAVPMVADMPLTGQPLTNFGNDYSSGTGCNFTSNGPDRVYELMVPANKLATVTVTPGAGLNTSVSLVDGAANCAQGMLRCVATSPSATTGAPDIVRWTNRSATAKTLLVLVDTAAPGAGTFDIVATMTDPPAGDSCANATALTTGAPVAGTTVGFFDDYAAGATTSCATFSTLGNDRVYGFSVPNGQRARVTVTPADAGFTPSLSLVAGAAAACEVSPRVCAAAANSGSSGAARTAAFFNGTGTAQGTFAIVDGSGSGDFTIGLTTAAPPVDDVCTTATTTLGANPLTNQTVRPAGITFERDYPCVSASRGPDRVYVAQAPANQRLTVTVTPTMMVMDGGFDPVLSLIAGPASACDSATRRCVAGVDDGSRNQPETASFTNASGAAQTVFVVVGSYSETDTDTVFSVSGATSPIVAGEVCENAQPIASGAALMNETLTTFSRDYVLGLTCSRSSGAERVYSISVGPNQTLTARGVPDMMADIVLNLIDGPAANCNASSVTCLTSADRGASGQEDRITWQNTTAAAKTVFIVVSNYRAGMMTYSLEAQVQ